MRKNSITLFGLLLIIVLAVSATGVILAQDGGDDDTEPAWLGITYLETAEGVVVQSVISGSPASAADLLINDVILSVDGTEIDSGEALVDAVQAHTPGDVVEVVVLRNSTERTLEVEFGKAPPTSIARRGMPQIERFEIMPFMGLMVEEVDEGLLVTGVGRGRMGDSVLQEGDIITAINGQPALEVEWLALMTEMMQDEDHSLTLTVLRDGEEIEVEWEGGFFGGGFRGEWMPDFHDWFDEHHRGPWFHHDDDEDDEMTPAGYTINA